MWAAWLPDVYGQFVDVRIPERMGSRQQAGLYLRWEGVIPAHGWIVELPRGWRLKGADLVEVGRLSATGLAIESLPGPGGRYRVEAPARIVGPQELVLDVESGSRAAAEELRIWPFVLQEANGRQRPHIVDAAAVSRRVMVARQESNGPNRVLELRAGEVHPVLTHPAGVQPLRRASFTAELWLKTTVRNSIVLSTWTGNEEDPYPLELMIDARGRLTWYWGQPGWHQSLATADPVADGAWRHVAVVHDDSRSAYRLFIDGRVVDSLHTMGADLSDENLLLGIGRRPTADGRNARFAGWVDELRLWGTARSQAEIAASMRVPAGSARGDCFVLGFEDPATHGGIEPRPSPERIQSSDLALLQPVRNLRADVHSGTVDLTWSAYVTETRRFVIERSGDGLDFERVGEVEPHGGAEGGPHTFRFSDYLPADERAVWFYRIRQVFDGDAEQVSGTVKIGLGGSEAGAVSLIGVSPNPFSAWTSVSFEVKQPEHVRLGVWDISGHQVDLLADRTFEPGRYQMRFAADGLPSGMYFVRLETQRTVQTVTMALMK